jgi:two-component system, OmpR family, sensor histidine kinase KdpD
MKSILAPGQAFNRIEAQSFAGRASVYGSVVAAATGLSAAAFYMSFNLSTAGSLELLLVLFAALKFGFKPATVASLTASLWLNFLFTPPLFKLSVSDPEDWISLATFEITAILVSALSSKAMLHGSEAETERKRSTTLYELSRAILLIDGRSSTVDQLSALIREFLEVEEVKIWLVYTPKEETSSDVQSGANADNPLSAQSHYWNNKDIDDPELRCSVRVVRIGTTSIGAMVLRGWDGDPLMADALASLVATAVERIRAIQQEHRAEAERNVERLRTTVLDGLAHGFKTPLTAIQTASSGLIALNGLNPTQAELVSIIDDQVTMLGQMTTRLLQTAALESKQIRLRRTETALPSVIYSVLEQQDQDAQSRIVVQVQECMDKVFVDQQLLELALTQLIDNAIKYSFVDHQISVTLTQNEQESMIAISNEGYSIRFEDRERIFERFYRGFDANHGPPGTGLGLSVVKKTAEAHGGTVRVLCDATSTTFTLTLPRERKPFHE